MFGAFFYDRTCLHLPAMLFQFHSMDATTFQPSESLSLRLKNISASLFLLLAAYLLYSVLPYYQAYASKELFFFSYHFVTRDALQLSYAGYGVLLLIYYLSDRNPRVSKSIYCLRVAGRFILAPVRTCREGLSSEERLGLLTTLLKAFYAPLMVPWLLDHTTHMITNGSFIFTNYELLRIDFLTVFNAHGFWFLFQVILFLDVFFFTIGYLVEMPFLKNQIRSVDPTLLGWAVALACYPPFNKVTSTVLGWTPIDFPHFESPAVHVSANFLLLSLMAVYTSASVALNFKASNLTHRGIIATGPYRFIRHPAYTCKNLAWWIAAVPGITLAYEASFFQFASAIASVAGWSILYGMRALTEEDHLRKVDGEYDEYCQKVRYRFIPGLI